MTSRERNFSYRDFSGGCLRLSDFSSSDLEGADFSRADLGESNLSHANLGKANLSGANLFHADLGKASLSGADLTAASFHLADLRDADLRGAFWSLAPSFSRAMLRGARIDPWLLPHIRDSVFDGCLVGGRESEALERDPFLVLAREGNPWPLVFCRTLSGARVGYGYMFLPPEKVLLELEREKEHLLSFFLGVLVSRFQGVASKS